MTEYPDVLKPIMAILTIDLDEIASLLEALAEDVEACAKLKYGSHVNGAWRSTADFDRAREIARNIRGQTD